MAIVRRAFGRWLIAALLLQAGFCVFAQSFGVTDARGKLIQLDQPPQRIVSLLPSLTESVCALRACDRIVGTDRYSNWPESVLMLPKLGGLGDTSIEAIVSLQPDVVLLAPANRLADRLGTLGLTTVVLDAQNSAGLRTQLLTIGQLLGNAPEAEQLWQSIQREIDQAAMLVPASALGQRVYFEVAPAPFAAGASSFIGELLARLGLSNIVPKSLGTFPRLNAEYIVRAQPDIIMAVSTELRAMPTRPAWRSLRALREQRICGFEPTKYEWIIRPGPRMGQAAALLVECLHQLERQAKSGRSQ